MGMPMQEDAFQRRQVIKDLLKALEVPLRRSRRTRKRHGVTLPSLERPSVVTQPDSRGPGSTCPAPGMHRTHHEYTTGTRWVRAHPAQTGTGDLYLVQMYQIESKKGSTC